MYSPAKARDTDDCEGAIVDAQCLAKNRRRFAVTRLPELVGDNDYRLGAGAERLVGAKESTKRGTETERREVIPRDEKAVRSLGVIASANSERRHAKRHEVGQ